MLLETPVITVHTLSSSLGYKLLEDINYIEYIFMSLTVLMHTQEVLAEKMDRGWIVRDMDG